MTTSRRSLMRRAGQLPVIAALSMRFGQRDEGKESMGSDLRRGNDIGNGLALRERVAQLVISPVSGTSLSDAEAERLALLKPGGVILVGANIGPETDIAGFVAAIKATNPDMPPLLCVDQEGGAVARLPDDPAPDAPTLGTLSTDDVRAASVARSEHVLAYGFDINFAPVADIAFSPDSFIVARSFGSDPEVVGQAVAATIDGASDTGVISAVKHFPGHGRTPVDSHEELPEISIGYDEWLATDAVPFVSAIAVDVPMVMLGHLRYPAWPEWDDAVATFSNVAVRTLRDDLEFDNVIVTDDLGMGALSAWDPFEVVDRALDAGVDMLLYVVEPVTVEQVVDHVVARIERGDLSESRIDESLDRIRKLREMRSSAGKLEAVANESGEEIAHRDREAGQDIAPNQTIGDGQCRHHAIGSVFVNLMWSR